MSEPAKPVIDHATPDAPRSGWRTVTRWLLVINVAIFLIDIAIALIFRTGVNLQTHDGQLILTVDAAGRPATIRYPVLAAFGYFSFDMAIHGLQIWRFISYQFCHASIMHIVVNMMGLLLAGPIVEERLGRWRFLAFYLLCGMAGPVAHLVFAWMGLMTVNIFTPLVGASASIYGILVAAARIAPNEMVMLAFPPIDLKLRTLAIGLIVLSLLAVLYSWQNAGGHAAHIGGAVMGWFLIRRFMSRVQSF